MKVDATLPERGSATGQVKLVHLGGRALTAVPLVADRQQFAHAERVQENTEVPRRSGRACRTIVPSCRTFQPVQPVELASSGPPSVVASHQWHENDELCASLSQHEPPELSLSASPVLQDTGSSTNVCSYLGRLVSLTCLAALLPTAVSVPHSS